MSSSISNSKFDADRQAVQWICIFCAVFMILFIGMLMFNYNYTSFSKVVEQAREAQLTASKIYAPERFDIVMSGSSRINYGMDPDTMQPYFPQARIYNCAMFGGSINKEILDYLEKRKIDWKSPGTKIVILELSARVMWNSLRKNKNYRSILQKSPDEIATLLKYSPDQKLTWDNLMQPMDRERWNMRKKRKNRTRAICHPRTGWYEVVNISEEISNDREVRKRFASISKNQVDLDQYDIKKSLDEILQKVRQWHERGVVVIGVAPPIDPRVKLVEEKLSSYNEAHVHALFEKAGGKVIKVSDDYLVILGGSHLDSDEAKRFSRETAEQILLHLKSLPKRK